MKWEFLGACEETKGEINELGSEANSTVFVI